MRKVVLCAFFVAVLASEVGCSGLMAKKEMAAIIDSNAVTATVQRELAVTGTLTDAAATKILTDNAGIFAGYACVKTVNAFEYMFNEDKKILVNGEYAERLDKANALAAETLMRAGLPNATPEFRRQAVIRESNVLIMIKDARDGRRSE